MIDVHELREQMVDQAVEDIRQQSHLYIEGSRAWEDHVAAILYGLVENWR